LSNNEGDARNRIDIRFNLHKYMTIDQLPTPALLLDYDILEQNLRRMQNRARDMKVALRPHIKTHKCIEIAKMQSSLGANGITVSTFYEAEQFAAKGFTDITWALPFPFSYTEKAVALSSKITLRVIIDSQDAVAHLEHAFALHRGKLHVWLEIDCGSHRTGVNPDSQAAEELAGKLTNSQTLIFDGILTHAGHSYHAKSKDEIMKIAEEERSVMVHFAERLQTKGINIPSISVGSTPTMTLAKSLNGVNEMRPGNYVFHDYTQAQLGVCTVGDCALTVLTSVISHQPSEQFFVTDAGALALSKDLGATHLRNDMGMGAIYEDYERKRLFAHIDLQIQTLSQEHGKIVAEQVEHIKGQFKVGEKIRILEHHSCLTAANFDCYNVTRGREVIGQWKILRGRT
jgi:D-serine deaminase-like pyridoxal phosphate-dependent protein